MDLCAAGGVVDFEAVEDALPAHVMEYWLAWDAIRKYERDKADLRAAIVAACVVAHTTSEAHHPDEYRVYGTDQPTPDPDESPDSEELDEEDLEVERERQIARSLAEQALFQ